jgi:hypothetical protein
VLVKGSGVLELELRVDLMPAETMVARRIDAVAIPHGQRDVLRESERQVDAEAGETLRGRR